MQFDPSLIIIRFLYCCRDPKVIFKDVLGAIPNLKMASNWSYNCILTMMAIV